MGVERSQRESYMYHLGRCFLETLFLGLAFQDAEDEPIGGIFIRLPEDAFLV